MKEVSSYAYIIELEEPDFRLFSVTSIPRYSMTRQPPLALTLPSKLARAYPKRLYLLWMSEDFEGSCKDIALRRPRANWESCHFYHATSVVPHPGICGKGLP